MIQGITLCGVLFDEAALMPRSFVEQAVARCSRDGSKLWFNCNPEYPQHWFNLEWVKKADFAALPQWEGDRIFLRLLEENAPFFSLKLCYAGDRLTFAALNGRPMAL